VADGDAAGVAARGKAQESADAAALVDVGAGVRLGRAPDTEADRR
jgi:hypothetical protein